MKILDLFKGLTKEYYFRQLFFGLIIGAAAVYVATQGATIIYGMIIMAIISTILYPYSRFAYETIMKFILGDTIFIHNIVVFMGWKAFTILLCWSFAIFVAPIGLIFIYFYQRKHKAQ